MKIKAFIIETLSNYGKLNFFPPLSWTNSKRETDQPILCPSHCKLPVILSILQFQAADNQLVFVHHQAFHNYFVFFYHFRIGFKRSYHHNDHFSIHMRNRRN